MRWAVLLCALTFSSVAWAVPHVPLVTVSSADEADDSDALPDGCMWRFVCYSPPSGENTADWIRDNKWNYLLLRDVAVVGLSFVPLVNLTFPIVWIPFLFHFTIPEDVRPTITGDLLVGMLLFTLGQVALGILTLPILFLPGGFFAFVAIYWTTALWIAPVTLLHLYNSAMLKNVDGNGSTRREHKRKKKAHRPPVVEDDDD